ncbi:MAG: DoxX family membrane protein [Spirochaetes bacterium]|nr:DoxX family membrane protein [Spirochaetota bacterium]
MAYRSYSPGLLRLILGAFFIILGIADIFPEIGESIFYLNVVYNWMYILFGVVEILCGLLILLGFIMFNDVKPIQWGSLIAFIFWVARIVFSRFIGGLSFAGSYGIDWYKFFEWCLIFSTDLIIAFAILSLMRRYE